MIDATTLNQVAEILGTTDKTLVFGAVLKALVQSGVSMDVAFDGVFGNGAYKAFAGQVYEALRAGRGL